MSHCPHCGQTHLLSSQLCPECHPNHANSETHEDGGVSAPGEGDCRVAIARFQNGAEAGYFADELTRETQLEAEVVARERFDAVHAAWSVDYLLLVDRPHAERAARMLQTLVDATGGETDEERAPDSPSGDLPGRIWVPLILTLAAGSIACFGIERVDQRARPPALVVRDPREPPELWEILAAARGSWVQKIEGRRGLRELTLDPETRTARLREDRDGDGRFDGEWEFSWKNR
jgi:hypothetical protein